MEAPPPPAPARGKLLIADDDELFRLGLCQWLQRHGYECVAVRDAAAAMEQLQAVEFEAMIADIHMPGNASLELVEQVPQLAAGLPLILLTGRPTVETASRAVRLPVAAYLVKPPVFEELDRLLQELITAHAKTRMINQSRESLREWDLQLQALALRFQRRPAEATDGGLADFLRLTLQQVIRQLVELERTAGSWQRQATEGAELPEIDLVGALERTVAVLAQTRQNFKCKQLADLRHQLEDLLERREPAEKK